MHTEPLFLTQTFVLKILLVMPGFLTNAISVAHIRKNMVARRHKRKIHTFHMIFLDLRICKKSLTLNPALSSRQGGVRRSQKHFLRFQGLGRQPQQAKTKIRHIGMIFVFSPFVYTKALLVNNAIKDCKHLY